MDRLKEQLEELQLKYVTEGEQNCMEAEHNYSRARETFEELISLKKKNEEQSAKIQE